MLEIYIMFYFENKMVMWPKTALFVVLVLKLHFLSQYIFLQ